MIVVVLLVSVIAAVVPIAGYLAFIWWMDRYEREPVWLTIVTFLWGAVGGIVGALVFATIFQSGIDAALGHARQAAVLSDALGTVLVAPVVEEATKGAILLLLLATRQFDNTTDGILYGAATGLGFAMTENFCYFMGTYAQGGVGAWMSNIVIRTLFSAVVHCCASGSFGFFLGLSRYRRGFLTKLLFLPAGYLAGISIHAFWNGSLTLGGLYRGGGVFAAGAFVVVPLIALTMVVITQISLHIEHRMLRRELEEEEKLGYIPAGHAAILPFTTKRNRAGWLPPNVPHKQYVSVATLLAFRKSQARIREGAAAQPLLREVDELRRQVVKLILGDRPAPGPAARSSTMYVEVPLARPPQSGS